MPKISLVIPAWNSEKTIGACLQSIFGQTIQDLEVIVVNDGSTDRTLEELASFRDRIILINQEHQGSNPARNRGWAAASGEYLFFLDSDITFLEDKALEKFLAALESNPRISYAYSSFYFGSKFFRLWPFEERRLRKMPSIPTYALVRAKDFPGFDEKIKRLQDWDVWLTMLAAGKKGLWIPEALLRVEPRANGISQWVPRWIYWVPWSWLPWQPIKVRKYLEAVLIIKKKHGLIRPIKRAERP